MKIQSLPTGKMSYRQDTVDSRSIFREARIGRVVRYLGLEAAVLAAKDQGEVRLSYGA